MQICAELAVFVYFSLLKLLALAKIVLFYTYLFQFLLLYFLLYYLNREVLLRRWRSALRAQGMIKEDVRMPHHQLNLACIQVLVLSLLALLVLSTKALALLVQKYKIRFVQVRFSRD